MQIEGMKSKELRLRGKVEGLAGRQLRGWIWDEANPETRLNFDLLVDGVYVATHVADEHRSDLARAGIGDGGHAFAILLPGPLFDGNTHDITVREVTSGRQLAALKSATLDAALRPEFVGELEKIEDGFIHGYVYNARDPLVHIGVALRASGNEVAFVMADLPSRNKSVSNCNFKINIAELEISAVAGANCEIVALPDRHVIASNIDLISNLANMSLQTMHDFVLVNVELSVPPRKGIIFDVYIDDALRMQMPYSPLNPSNRIVGHLPIEDISDKTHYISVRLSGTDRHIGGSPRSFGRRVNLLKNSFFKNWTGSTPDGWSLTLPNDAIAEPVYAIEPSAVNSEALATALTISGLAPSTINGVVVAQEFYTNGLESIDIILGVRADARTMIQVRLAPSPSIIDELSSRKPENYIQQNFVAWSSWSTKRLTFRLPNFLQDGLVCVCVEVAESQASRLSIHTFAAGTQGFEQELETNFMHPLATNAVLNGTMSYWQGPLRKTVRFPITDLAEGWTLSSKKQDDGIEARLTEIMTRDPKRGRSGSLAHAIAIVGTINNGYIRLETTLDTFQLAAAVPQQLSFYAKAGADRSADVEKHNRTTIIEEIMIIERHNTVDAYNASEKGKFSEERVCSVAKRVTVTPVGERFIFDLDMKSANRLRQIVQANMSRQDIIYLLAFQFSKFVDIAITEVEFGHAVHERVESELAGFISIEDPNIASQLGRLKGFTSWSHPSALLAPSEIGRKPVVGEIEDIRWTWPDTDVKSVEIVICVHNALDETLDCLASIRRFTEIPYTLTIVDDASEQLVSDRLRLAIRDFPWMRIVSTETNVGYTRAANMGLSSTKAEWIVLLNSDTIVTPNWLQGMFEVIDAYPDVAMVGPLSNAASWQTVPDLHDTKSRWKVNTIPEHMSINQVASCVRDLSARRFPSVALLNGFCTLMKRSVVEEVGFLDEQAFPEGYGEENDLCVRVSRAGYRLAIADHVYVYHVKSASFGRERRDILSKRGTASFIAKHPDVDLTEITRALAEETTLTEMRLKLRSRLNSLTMNITSTYPRNPS